MGNYSNVIITLGIKININDLKKEYYSEKFFTEGNEDFVHNFFKKKYPEWYDKLFIYTIDEEFRHVTDFESIIVGLKKNTITEFYEYFGNFSFEINHFMGTFDDFYMLGKIMNDLTGAAQKAKIHVLSDRFSTFS